MSSWKFAVCGLCDSRHQFPNLNSSVAHHAPINCPFDRFYDRIVGINRAAQRLTPTNDQELLNLLIVEIVSSVESYVREILSGVISACPTAKRDSAEFSVSLASALWGFSTLHSRLGFEQNSLAGSKNLQSALNKLGLLTNKSDKDITTLLEEYDKLCELRHVIAHAKGLITGKNAVVLGIERSPKMLEIQIRPSDIEATAALALALCRALHQEIFYTLSKRWALEWKKDIPNWNRRTANREFKRLWKMFYSEKDRTSILPMNALTEIQVRKKIEEEFHIQYA